MKKKVIYNCVNKNNINPTSVYKWNDERSSHGLANICIQNVFEKIVSKLQFIRPITAYSTESFIGFSLYIYVTCTTLKNQN